MYTTAAETKSRKIYDEFGIENQVTLFVAFYKLEKVGDYKKNFYKLSPHWIQVKERKSSEITVSTINFSQKSSSGHRRRARWVTDILRLLPAFYMCDQISNHWKPLERHRSKLYVCIETVNKLQLKKCKQTFSLTFVHWIKTSCIKIRLFSKSHVLSVVCVGLVSFSPLHSSLSHHDGPWSQQRSPSQCNEPVTQPGNMWQGTDVQWFILSTQFCFWFYVFMVHWPLICERKALSPWSVRLTRLKRSSLAHINFQPQPFPTLIYSTKIK